MKDREKVEFLRHCGMMIGHTDGTPFSAASVELRQFDSERWYKMETVEKMLTRFGLIASGLEVPNINDQFVYQLLTNNSVFHAFEKLNEKSGENNDE